jgi:hypothetical protein
MNEPIILTHCGQLGDFIYSLPIASWLWKENGRKIHFVLPRDFGPFRSIETLLLLQPFTARVSLVDYRVAHYGHGGQPYKFNPAQFGLPGDYINLGLRGAPNRFITEFMADEYRLGWDEEFTLNLGPRREEEYHQRYDARWIFERFIGEIKIAGGAVEVYRSLTRAEFEYLLRTHPYNDDFFKHVAPVESREPHLYTEHANFPPGRRINLFHNVLFNARWMREAVNRHCFHSSMAVILYFARVPFLLYRQPGHPRHNYFPDTSRFEGRELP